MHVVACLRLSCWSHTLLLLDGMAPGQGSSPAMMGAVDGPHYQRPVLHLGSAPTGWCPDCPNERLDKDPTESPRNAQLSPYPDTEIK